MNTDSFKQRQLLFQSGGNQSKEQPKPRPSAPLINKDIFETKSKNSNSNNNNKTINSELNNNLKKTNSLNSNSILKIANQMKSKNNNNINDIPGRKSIPIEPKTDLNLSKDNILKKTETKKDNDKKERKESDLKENIKKFEKKESEIKKEDKKEVKKNKIEEIKKQMEKGNSNKNEDKKKEKEDEKDNELKANKKDEKNNENKKDKINEIAKKFEKEKKDSQKSLDNSFRKESYNKEIKNDNKINEILKDLNLNKEKDKENNNKNNANTNSPKNSPVTNITKKREFKETNINLNQEKNTEKKIEKNTINDDFEIIDKDYFENEPEDAKEIPNKKQKSLSDLEIDNFKDFNEEDYLERKYDKSTIDKGKIFFKYRYLKNKYTQINETIRRLSTVNNDNINRLINNRISAANINNFDFNKINNTNNKRNTINIDEKFKLSNNIHLSFFIQNPSAQCLNSIDKDSELRHYHSQFLQITEKSILCFNLKKYEESYLYLFQNNIIKSMEEFSEFLLVVNGFDKFIIGEFLSNNQGLNEKKEVLKNFINSVKMNWDEISFLECFRFFMKRLYLPKDANLILEIMSTFSEIYFNYNKKFEEFKNIYKNSNNIYLLISTILALNTMFTRKDIKNINIIKKEEFIAMNKDIQDNVLVDIYDKLAKNPLIIDNENYNENIYKRMTTLVKEKISSSNINPIITKSKTFNGKATIELKKKDEDPNFIIKEEDSDDEYDSILNINTSNPEKQSISVAGGGTRPFLRSSFSLTKNLYSFTKQDQDILSSTQKFFKLVGNGMLHEREFLVYDNFTQLIWGKSIEQNKVKNNLHCLLITDIYDVFNGIEHSDNLKKYILANPKEAKEKNNFITIISNKKEINLKSNSLQTSLLWYKALKSLVLKTKNENFKKNSKTINEQNTQFKLQLEELWKDFILPKWNIYGNYILLKLKQKDKIQGKKENYNSKNIDTIIRDTENDKILEYSDFFEFFYLGLPSFCRGTIWRLLIGNPCCITETLYENYLPQVEQENFNEFDIKYHEDINTIFNREYNLNQMITDIIKTKDFFLSDLIKLKIDEDKIMNESYNILRIFFLMRNDLVYKKSIVPLIFVFLMVDDNEYNAFCNVYNLLLSTDIIKFYIDDEDYINKSVIFFSELVKKYLPKIHEHFTNLEIEHELYFIPWMNEIFSSSMSYKLLLRVLDLYLINGEYILFQIGLSILSIQEDDLLDLAINEIFKLLKKLSSKYKEDSFLEKMKSFDCIKDEFNKWKNENELGMQKLQLFQAIFNDDK